MPLAPGGCQSSRVFVKISYGVMCRESVWWSRASKQVESRHYPDPWYNGRQGREDAWRGVTTYGSDDAQIREFQRVLDRRLGGVLRRLPDQCRARLAHRVPVSTLRKATQSVSPGAGDDEIYTWYSRPLA